MAEVAFAFLGSLGAAAGSAATSAAAWGLGTTVTTAAGVTSGLGASTLAGLAGAGSTALSVLEGVATAASVVSTLVGGVSALAESSTQADLAKLQGNAEYIASEQKALNIRRDLVQKVGAARVAFAGSGLDISSSAAVESDLTAQADFETAIEKSNAESAKIQAAMRAKQYRTSGVADFTGSIMKGFGQVAGFGLDIAKRG